MTNHERLCMMQAVSCVLDGTFTPLMLIKEELAEAGETAKAWAIKEVIDGIVAENNVLRDIYERGYHDERTI